MTHHQNLTTATTQPILCCIGHSVTASPTQFLMERAIAATQLDWRAITAEVAPADLGAALAGMSAMKFMAVRFFPSLQAPALEHVLQHSQDLHFVGGVTSAARTAEGWQAWHNWGLACLGWLANQVDLRQSICWLHADSIRCRSLLVALQHLAAEKSTLPSAVLWTSPARDIPQHLKQIDNGQSPLTLQLFDHDPQLTSHAAELLTSLAQAHHSPNLIFIGDELPSPEFELQADIAGWLVVGSASVVKRAAERRLPQLSTLSEVEQIVMCEAYDFKRWTGQPINPAILQDAYDEYCDF